MKEIKTVALVGLGAIGAYFADRLQPVLGDDLRVIAGGARAERIRREGLVINGKQEYYHVVEPGEGEPADLVIFATKMSGLQQAIEDVRARIGPETLILSPLNGVESEEVVAKTYGWENIVYSLMRISSVKVGNTVSFDPNAAFYVEYGEKKNDPTNLSERVLRLKALFDGAGIRYQIRPDMLLAIWEKFACNVSENQVAAVLDLPYGAWGSCEDAEALRIMVAAEVIEIAQKKGIPIETNYARDHLDVIKAVPPRNKPSTLQDILAGRKTEVDIFAGAVIRLGKEYGVPTPYNEFLYHAIRVLEAKNAGTVEGV